MRILRPRPGSGRLRLPRRTARLRLTVLFGAAFLVCGMAVLAIVTSVAFGDTKVGSAGSNGAPAAVFNGKVPAAAVRQAGGTDLVPVPIPVGDIRQEGGYDIVSIRMPVAASRSPAATAAEEAREAAAQVEVNYDERQILIICAIALAVIALAAAAIGWFIAGRVLRPVSTITALDGLFARLEASFDAQRRFAANASHELRTPLTRERTLLQVTLADPASTTDTWQAVSRELLTSNAEQERLIEALLTLASGEAATGPREPLDLAAISREALAAACPAIKRLDLDVQADIEPAVLDGDPQLVQQLVTNLIDNAARHNIPGGDIQVATTTIGDRAVLSVTNPGQVIPAAEVDRLFQPFQRLGPRSVRRDGGHGLGLSIVRAIATAHGATITAKPRPGGGLVIKVTFPPPILAQHRRALSTADSGVADGGVSVPRRDLRWPTGH
jgi:signal transduction histidine kinase